MAHCPRGAVQARAAASHFAQELQHKGVCSHTRHIVQAQGRRVLEIYAEGECLQPYAGAQIPGRGENLVYLTNLQVQGVQLAEKAASEKRCCFCGQ